MSEVDGIAATATISMRYPRFSVGSLLLPYGR